MTHSPNRPVPQVAAFTFLSWLGSYLHHRIDLPQIHFLHPEHLIPTVISLTLFLAWWRLPYQRATTLLLCLWALLPQFLGGGILSVLPLNFWPFSPPQTWLHYATHVMYTLAQVPLLVLLLAPGRSSGQPQKNSGDKAR